MNANIVRPANGTVLFHAETGQHFQVTDNRPFYGEGIVVGRALRNGELRGANRHLPFAEMTVEA